jgi:hypothetical protein
MSSSSSGVGNPFVAPGPGKYLLAGKLGSSPAPEAYVVVTESNLSKVSLTIQFLGAKTRKLVGTPATYSDAPSVLATSTEVELGMVTIPADANPVAQLPIVAEKVVLEFRGTAMAPCGTLRGATVSPVKQPLDGSKFAMTPVASAESLPANPATSCP